MKTKVTVPQVQFIASKLVAAYSSRILNSRYTSTLQTSTSNIYAIAFSAGLNCHQLDQVNIKNNSQISTYTQILASELVQLMMHMLTSPGVA